MMTFAPKLAGGTYGVIRNIHHTVGTNHTFLTTSLFVMLDMLYIFLQV